MWKIREDKLKELKTVDQLFDDKYGPEGSPSRNEFEARAKSYYYAELLMLDAGSWFNTAMPALARDSYTASRNGSFVDGHLHYSTGQYVSTLQDLIAYASGRMLRRSDDGERILPYHIKAEYQGKTLHQIWQSIAAKGEYKDVYMDFLEYDFTNAYVADPQDTGNRPGVYLEFKRA